MSDLSNLTDEELIALEKNTINNISKYNNVQMAKKILNNSIYGALGSPDFRYYSEDLAAGVTITGQTIIKKSEQAFNGILDKLTKTTKDRVAAIDTDSCYLILDDIVDLVCSEDSIAEQLEFVDRLCQTKLQKTINDAYETLSQELNSYTNKSNMKREAIGHGYFVQKKRYFMLVYDNEGVRYEEPKLKAMGLETARSSTPTFCKEAMKQIFRMVFKEDQVVVQDYISECYEGFKKLSPEEISISMGVSSLEKWDNTDENTNELSEFMESSLTDVDSKSGTPMQVKASMLYNNLITQYPEAMLPEIKAGDKIKLVRLKTPNPFRSEVLAYKDTLPKCFDIHKYVDYDDLWKKTFIAPLQRVFDVTGWSTDRLTTDISDFF